MDGVVTRRVAAWEEEILVPDGIPRHHRILDGVTRRVAIWEEEMLVPDGIRIRHHQILDGVIHPHQVSVGVVSTYVVFERFVSVYGEKVKTFD